LEEERFEHSLENHERVDRNLILVLFKHTHTHKERERERKHERRRGKSERTEKRKQGKKNGARHGNKLHLNTNRNEVFIYLPQHPL